METDQQRRDSMSKALDAWFEDNGATSGVPEGACVSYERVVARSIEGQEHAWLLSVDGMAGDVEFSAQYTLTRPALGLPFEAVDEKFVKMNPVRKRQNADKSMEEVQKKSDACDGSKILHATGGYSPLAGDRAAVLKEMTFFGETLQKWYTEKQGDLLDELRTNLRVPTGGDASSAIAGLAFSLKSEHHETELYRHLNELELVVLRGYTQCPFDIDRDMGWPDAPPPESAYEEEKAKRYREEYQKANTSWMWEEASGGRSYRNGSLYAAVCSALRDQGPGGGRGEWSERLIKMWIKWIATLARVSSTDQPCQEVLWRGLGGGGLTREIVERHQAFGSNEVLSWPAPSSASYNYEMSRSYAFGTAVNSTAKLSEKRPGTLMFNMKKAMGIPIQSISQYPKEQEVLLCPLSLFAVHNVTADASNPFDCGADIEMECLGPLGGTVSETPWLRRFYEKVQADTQRSSERLRAVMDGLSLRPTWKQTSTKGSGWDVVVASLRNQVRMERANIVERSRDMEVEVKELRKDRQRLTKLEREHQLEMAEHQALRKQIHTQAETDASASLALAERADRSEAKVAEQAAELARMSEETAGASKEARQHKCEVLELQRAVEEEKGKLKEVEALGKTRATALESELSSLMEQCRRYTQELVEWKARAKDAAGALDETARRAEQKYAETIRDLRQEVKEAKAGQREEQAQGSAAAAEASRAQQAADAKAQEADRLRLRIDAERRRLKDEASTLHAKCSAAEHAAAVHKAAHATEEREAERQKKLLEREAKTLRELRQTGAEAQTRLREETVALREQLREETLLKKKHLAERDRALESCAAEKEGREALAKKLEAQKARHQEVVEEHRQVVAELHRRSGRDKEDRGELEAEHKREVGALRATQTKLESQLKHEEERLKRQQQQDAQASVGLRARLEEGLARSHAEVEGLKEQAARLHEEGRRARQRHDEELAKAKAQLKAAEAQAQDLGAQLRVERKQALERGVEAEEARRLREKAQVAADEGTARLAKAEELLRRSGEEVSGLRADVAAAERERQRLEQQGREGVERMNQQMEALRDASRSEATRADRERRANAGLHRDVARANAERDASERVAGNMSQRAELYKDTFDRSLAASSPTPSSALSPTSAGAAATPSPMSPASPASIGVARYSDASPGMQRIEATTRRLRREVDSLRTAMPPSPRRVGRMAP